MKATTPKGREVLVHDIQSVGSSGHSGRLSFGDVPVAYWCTFGSGANCLEAALVQADFKIDTCGLHE